MEDYNGREIMDILSSPIYTLLREKLVPILNCNTYQRNREAQKRQHISHYLKYYCKHILDDLNPEAYLLFGSIDENGCFTKDNIRHILNAVEENGDIERFYKMLKEYDVKLVFTYGELN